MSTHAQRTRSRRHCCAHDSTHVVGMRAHNTYLDDKEYVPDKEYAPMSMHEVCMPTLLILLRLLP
eukprot:1280411-Pleurochrysis_carterae.AAC.1